MRQVTVRVDELVETLKANREKHQSLFEEALEGYRERAIELLTQHIERIRAGKTEQVNVILPRPENHTSDYDQAIAMLEMTLRAGEEIIDIDNTTFAQYVLDDWHWKRDFLSSNAMYSVSAQSEWEAMND